MLREGNFRAVATKLRLKQTPMILFSSQTSDSFHFLNNKAFLWNEVTASICQVDISTKISQECGWRGLASRASRAPEAGESLLPGQHRDKLPQDRCGEQSLWHHHTNSPGCFIHKQPAASSTHCTAEEPKGQEKSWDLSQGMARDRQEGAEWCHRSNSPCWVGQEQGGCDFKANTGLQAHRAGCTVQRAGQTSCSSTAPPVGLATQAAIHPATPEMLNIWGRAVTASGHSLGEGMVLFFPYFWNLAAYILTSRFQGCWTPNHSFDFRQSQFSSSEKQTFI